MTARQCAEQVAVQRAASSGRWTAELQQHARACEACREVALVTSALATDLVAPPRRFTPSIIWAKARHVRRLRAEALASRILLGGQVGTGVVGLVALAWFASSLEGSGAGQNVAVGPILAVGLPLAALALLAAKRFFGRV